ncbi:hypothetical protein WKR88_26485 [Trinickia caryophylli]|uniref:Metal ABC transporter ATPase n=3 Tax=Trinickia caryophylli TaxID=28094 RepID=A0A1X7GG03_TRICW|nr:hypothetical protein [Trinickia caryophylli]PMS08759.1 hypothetical protein C0Z17_28550 [Trinickia caryophylli]TRX15334.1 hypothetical protein FNF07_21370 [Trinickia caryophylli]WQE15507.1 hypothetical protein U0034_23580 [Trinickia caryophylli]SMF69255.1 hypothetical protein SAMN06295900_115151 [Trinickia caryophylli]GLU33745.1 hypothetical protein Busp01_35870 [Trinickia caryophylli]
MGIGMQIVYLGFPGAARIEAAAAVELLRLERFSGAISGCHLAIEAMHSTTVTGTDYDARLDLVTRDGKLLPMPHCANADPEAAIRLAFDRAEQALLDPEACGKH